MGRQILDSVEYLMYALEWPSQDISSRFTDIDGMIGIIEQRYGLSLGPLAERAKAVPILLGSRDDRTLVCWNDHMLDC